MRLEKFHQRLLSKQSGITPENYLVTEVQKTLYTEFVDGKRGYVFDVATTKDPELFLATFVVALYQTTVPSKEQVAFLIPSPLQPWAVGQMKTIARHFISIRKNSPRAHVDMLCDSFGRIVMGHSLAIKEPSRWVAYGYSGGKASPSWMEDRLCVGKPRLRLVTNGS